MIRRCNKSVVLCLCLFPFWGNGLFDLKGQTTDSLSLHSGLVDTMVDFGENVLQRLTYEKGRHSFAVYPAVGYTPRTGIEYGVMPIWRINPKEAESLQYQRATTVTSALLLSTTGMYEADLELELFSSNGFRVASKIQWLFLPDKFYGIGNHDASTVPFDFDASKLQLSGYVAKQMGQVWFAGLAYDFGRYKNDPEVQIPLAAFVEGGRGGWANSAGPSLVFDSRDNATYPRKGWAVQASWLLARPWMGSEFRFDQSVLDVRCYSPWGKAVLAAQFQLQHSEGQVPFFKMAALGGKRALRGIPHPNKYINNDLWFSQFELRRDVWWRIGAVAFAGLGQSFGHTDRLFDNVRQSAGVGLRFKALPRENLNFRIDYGIASGGDHALYFTLREAF